MEALEAAAAASGKASASKAVARSTTTLLVKNLPYRWGPGRWRRSTGRLNQPHADRQR